LIVENDRIFDIASQLVAITFWRIWRYYARLFTARNCTVTLRKHNSAYISTSCKNNQPAFRKLTLQNKNKRIYPSHLFQMAFFEWTIIVKSDINSNDKIYLPVEKVYLCKLINSRFINICMYCYLHSYIFVYLYSCIYLYIHISKIR